MEIVIVEGQLAASGLEVEVEVDVVEVVRRLATATAVAIPRISPRSRLDPKTLRRPSLS